MIREVRLCAESLSFPMSASTLFFGGGTPSLMEPSQLENIIEAAAKYVGIEQDAEITIEANPGTLTPEKLAGFRGCGVNRLSLGVQSFNDSVLDSLGRVHSAAQAVEAFQIARRCEYENIGIDLIGAVPGQTVAMWEQDLRSAAALGPEHVSAYGLSIEEGTPFAKMVQSGELALPDEEDAAVMFERTAEFLCTSGYEHYEISNYARKGFRSRHNQVYWRRGNYLGFGVASHSFLKKPDFGVRWKNTDDIGKYLNAINGGTLPRMEKHFSDLHEAMAERLFLGLRMLEGVDLDLFRREFGMSFEDAYPHESSFLFAEGFLENRGGRLMLAEKSLLVSNQIFMRFL